MPYVWFENGTFEHGENMLWAIVIKGTARNSTKYIDSKGSKRVDVFGRFFSGALDGYISEYLFCVSVSTTIFWPLFQDKKYISVARPK